MIETMMAPAMDLTTEEKAQAFDSLMAALALMAAVRNETGHKQLGDAAYTFLKSVDEAADRLIAGRRNEPDGKVG